VSKKSVKPQKSQGPFQAIIAVVALVGGAVLWQVTRPSAPQAIAVDPTAPPADVAGYVYGRPDAPITIAEYADFECPGCGQFAVLHAPDIKKRIVDAGMAKFVFYDFPLAMHPNAMAAHLAAACANEQGKFWDMHDRIFLAQPEWNTQATANPKKVLAGLAEQAGADMAQWNDCFDNRRHLGTIEANRNAGIKLGVGSTPTLRIGDQLYPGGLTADQVKQVVDSLVAAMPATVVPAAPGTGVAPTP
jgi:protein-disulfide isomerase